MTLKKSAEFSLMGENIHTYCNIKRCPNSHPSIVDIQSQPANTQQPIPSLQLVSMSRCIDDLPLHRNDDIVIIVQWLFLIHVVHSADSTAYSSVKAEMLSTAVCQALLNKIHKQDNATPACRAACWVISCMHLDAQRKVSATPTINYGIWFGEIQPERTWVATASNLISIWTNGVWGDEMAPARKRQKEAYRTSSDVTRPRLAIHAC